MWYKGSCYGCTVPPKAITQRKCPSVLGISTREMHAEHKVDDKMKQEVG